MVVGWGGLVGWWRACKVGMGWERVSVVAACCLLHMLLCVGCCC